MFIPFAFNIDPSFYNPNIASPKSLYVVGNFYAYKNYYLGNFAVLDTTGSQVTSFNNGSLTYNLNAGFNASDQTDYTFTSTFQSDNKVLVGGSFTNYSGSISTRGARVNLTGVKDTTWVTGNAGFSNYVYKMQVSGSNILAGGSFATYSGSSFGSFVKINSNGNLNHTYNPQVGSPVYTFATQSDGKAIVGGNFTAVSGSGLNRITRINSNGFPDTGFNIGTGFNSNVNSILVQSDGKIIVGGGFTTYSGSTANYFARLNISGTLDLTFTSGQSGVGAFNFPPTSLALQSDGKVIAYGNFTTYSGSSVNRIVRLNTNGSIDNTFNVGTGFNSYSFQIAGAGTDQNLSIDASGKIYVGGSFSSYSGSLINGIVRLNTNGTIDTTFNTSGSGGVNGLNSGSQVFSVRPSGSFVTLAGHNIKTWKSPMYGGYINLDTTGSVIPTPYIGTGFSGIGIYTPAASVRARVKQDDGKIVIGGSYYYFNDVNKFSIIRLNTDNTLDSTFNAGTLGLQSIGMWTLKALPSNYLISVGDFTTYSGSTVNRIVKIMPSGARDTSFNMGTGFNATVSSVIAQPDGKFVCVGSFTTYSGSAVSKIVRLNPDGTIDPTFSIGTGANSTATLYSSDIQPDGKILVSGNTFTTYNGSSVFRIARLLPSGALDTTFSTGTGFNFTCAYVKTLNDGKILTLGEYTTYNGSSSPRIARLLSSGALDTTFNVGTGVNFWPNEPYNDSIVEDPNSNIYLCGAFTTYSGSIVNGLVKILPSGSIDTTFVVSSSIQTGFNYFPKGVYLDT
jgi:uncharacterized delta-60 repeat protein